MMELKIEVDETKFKEVIEKELDAFSKEELHEIIRECIVDCLKNDDTLKNLFCTEKTNGYYGSKTIEPSKVLVEAAKTMDLSPAFKEIQESMIKELKENYHTLLEKVMLDMIMMGIANNYDFQNRMSSNIQLIIDNRRNN